MAAPPGPPHPGELQTCAGIGWVKLDRLGGGTQAAAPTAVLSEAPAVRCVGFRVSKPLAPAAGGQLLEPRAAPGPAKAAAAVAATARAAATKEGATAGDQVAEQTWALICAGQLSMIMPPTTAAGSQLATAIMASRTPQLEPPWAPCHLHCDGISFRVEKVVADGAAAEGDGTPLRREEAVAGAAAPVLGEAELLRAAFRGAEAVASRASSIVWSVRGATHETGPSRLAMNTAGQAKRICLQAGKIAKRSVEHVGRIVTLPWRIAGARDFGDGGGEPPSPPPPPPRARGSR